MGRLELLIIWDFYLQRTAHAIKPAMRMEERPKDTVLPCDLLSNLYGDSLKRECLNKVMNQVFRKVARSVISHYISKKNDICGKQCLRLI